MPILKAWIAQHTGLPSFHILGPGTLFAGSRKVAVVISGEVLLFSDALAPAGKDVDYTFDSTTAKLRRIDPRPPISGAGGFVTDERGRGVGEISIIDNKLPVSWSSDSQVFRSGATRFAAMAPLREGTSAFLVEPGYIEAFWKIVRGQHALIIGSYANVPEAELKTVIVKTVKAERIGSDGSHTFDVTWTEVPLGKMPLAGVVSWAEWEEWGKTHSPKGWQNWTELEIAQRISGMPSGGGS